MKFIYCNILNDVQYLSFIDPGQENAITYNILPQIQLVNQNHAWQLRIQEGWMFSR